MRSFGGSESFSSFLTSNMKLRRITSFYSTASWVELRTSIDMKEYTYFKHWDNDKWRKSQLKWHKNKDYDERGRHSIKELQLVATSSKVLQVLKRKVKEEHQWCCRQGAYEPLVDFKRQIHSKYEVCKSHKNVKLSEEDIAIDFHENIDEACKIVWHYCRNNKWYCQWG